MSCFLWTQTRPSFSIPTWTRPSHHVWAWAQHISIYRHRHTHCFLCGQTIYIQSSDTPEFPYMDVNTPTCHLWTQTYRHFHIWTRTLPRVWIWTKTNIYLQILRLGHAHISVYGFRHSWISSYGLARLFHMLMDTQTFLYMDWDTPPQAWCGESEARYRIGVFLFCIFYNLMIWLRFCVAFLVLAASLLRISDLILMGFYWWIILHCLLLLF